MRSCICIILFCFPLLFNSQDIASTIDLVKLLKTALHHPDSSLAQLSAFEKSAQTESKIKNVDPQTLSSIKAFCYYISGDSIQTALSLQRAFEKPNYKKPMFFQELFEKTFIKPPEVAAQAKNFIDYFFQSSLQSHNEIQLLTGYMLLQQFLELEENVPEAMRLNFKLLELEEVRKNEFIMIKSRVFSNLGRLSRMLGEYDKALHYHQSAIAFSPDTSDYHIELNINHRANIGNVYRESGNYLEAFKTDSAMLIKRYQIHDTNGIVYQHTSLAISLIFLGKIERALEELKKAEQFLNPRVRAYQKHKSRIANAWGEYSMRVNKYPQAVDYCITGYETALDSMRDQRLMRAIENCSCIYNAYEAMNKPIQAYDWYKKTISLRDSLLAKRNRQSLLVAEITRDHKQELFLDSLAQLEKERLISMRHHDEVQKKNKQRNILLGSGFFLLLLTGAFYSRWRYVRRSRAEIQKEKDRSENLLLNILPAEIAEELKEKGRTDARDYEVVSILFTDFKAFTETSEKLSAADLVHEINACFKAFDEVCEKRGIEKIKTIGDAYMAAGGLPVPTDDSVKNTIFAALDMQKFISARKKEKDDQGEPAFEMRVGVHTGPVVAGIVGVKKFQYDIWGDTVNTASRIESKGEVGKVNISQATYQYIKDDPNLEFESRGKISAKGKGEMEMWFVNQKLAI